MNGSLVYSKYTNVKTGALINFDNELRSINDWLKNNLFINANLDDVSSTTMSLYPLSADYTNDNFESLTLKEVCSNFNVRKTKVFKVKEGNKVVVKGIDSSFVMNKLFKTNNNNDISYDSNRFSLVEQDLQCHPKYSEIKNLIKEVKAQVTVYASHFREGKPVHADMTVLYSRPNCTSQALHKDDNRTSTEDFVMSAIVALEDWTKLDLAAKLSSTTRDTCHIPKGSFFLFSGSQVHAGSSYQYPNLRLHFYLHEDKSVLSQITDGTIVPKHVCQVPGCYFATYNELSLLNHNSLVHSVQHETFEVKPREDGKFHCEADVPCEDEIVDSANGIRRHYREHHLEWWNSVHN